MAPSGVNVIDATTARLGDVTLLSLVGGVFTRTAPSLIGAIDEALMAQDDAAAANEAHSLKGAVAVFEAPLVLKAVTDVERHAKAGDIIAARVAFERAKPLVSRLLEELTAAIS